MSHAKRLSGEFEYIEWARKQIQADPRVPIGIGDDAALLRITPGRELLVTTDMLLEGVHFDLKRVTVFQVGRKALGVNLSDIAAMAGNPVAAVVAVAIPNSFSRLDAEQLFRGIHELADDFGVAIVGGDTNRSQSGLVISVTVLGEASPRGPVRRSGARVGDWVLVTGSFGGSIESKHLLFTPRVREAATLHEHYTLHSMIDVSDGLAADLGHIMDESGCGALLEASAIPISDDARKVSGALTPLDRALYDGEDFELLFTLPEAEARRLLAEQPLPIPVSAVGRITEASELRLQLEDGTVKTIERRGYDHFRQ